MIEYHPEDMTIAVEAGITLGDLDGVLAARGQMLPLDPPLRDRITLGGMLATNASGPRRHGYGTLRDFCIGLHAAYVDGTLAKAGGMVVKNVTGFDLMKMHLGALGTLGVVTRINLKVLPKPAAERTLVAQFAGPAPAFAAAAALVASQLMPIGDRVQFPDDDRRTFRSPLDGYLLCVRCEGGEATVARQERDIRNLGVTMGRKEIATLAGDDHDPSGPASRTGTRPPPSPRIPPCSKSATLPTDLLAALTETVEEGRKYGLTVAVRASAGIGVAYMRVTGDESGEGLRPTLDAVHARWPTLPSMATILPTRTTLPIWGVEPADDQRHARLKASYDPHGTLNPGRFIGGI